MSDFEWHDVTRYNLVTPQNSVIKLYNIKSISHYYRHFLGILVPPLAPSHTPTPPTHPPTHTHTHTHTHTFNIMPQSLYVNNDFKNVITV